MDLKRNKKCEIEVNIDFYTIMFGLSNAGLTDGRIYFLANTLVNLTYPAGIYKN